MQVCLVNTHEQHSPALVLRAFQIEKKKFQADAGYFERQYTFYS